MELCKMKFIANPLHQNSKKLLLLTYLCFESEFHLVIFFSPLNLKFHLVISIFLWTWIPASNLYFPFNLNSTYDCIVLIYGYPQGQHFSFMGTPKGQHSLFALEMYFDVLTFLDLLLQFLAEHFFFKFLVSDWLWLLGFPTMACLVSDCYGNLHQPRAPMPHVGIVSRIRCMTLRLPHDSMNSPFIVKCKWCGLSLI